MSGAENNETAPNQEHNSSTPKGSLRQSFRNFIRQTTRNGVVGTRTTIRNLNRISPLLNVFVAIGLVWIAYWQWDALEKTDQTNRAVNRAFVRGKEMQIQQIFVNWMFKPVIENIGNTQTKNLEVFTTSSFALDEINDADGPLIRKRPAFAPPDPESASRLPGMTFPASLGPHSSIPIGGVGPTSKWIDQMAQNRSDGYVFGVIWYNDVFLRSERHISKFCFVVQPVKSGDQPTRITYGLCRYWNCIGRDECAEQKKEYEAELLELKKPPPAPK